jgi:hypothetical protein
MKMQFELATTFCVCISIFTVYLSANFDNMISAMWVHQKLLKQGYVAHMLKSSPQQLYGRHHHLVDRYEISISRMIKDILPFMQMFAFLYHCRDFCQT